MTDLSKRYPDHSRRRRIIGATAAVLLLALLGWFVYSASVHARPAVAARVESYDVRSDTEARAVVVFDRRSTADAVSCLVYAQAESFERVGELRVTQPAGGEDISRQSVVLRTFRRPTTVAVTDCRVE